MEKQIGLVEVWLGKIPDYFQFHLETIGTISCADFYFFTNDREYDFSQIKHDNFHVNYIDETEFLVAVSVEPKDACNLALSVSVT